LAREIWRVQAQEIKAMRMIGATPNSGALPIPGAAKQRARELGIEGTHRNRGRWMPCKDEAHLHQELRNR
jgi:hypothetical protein